MRIAAASLTWAISRLPDPAECEANLIGIPVPAPDAIKAAVVDQQYEAIEQVEVQKLIFRRERIGFGRSWRWEWTLEVT